MARRRDEGRVAQARLLAAQGKTQAEVSAVLGVPARTLRTWGIDWPMGRRRLPAGEGSRWTRRRRADEAGGLTREQK